jgi:hypothetical protein
MSIRTKIQDVLRILKEEVDGNNSAVEFVAEELAHQLSTVLIGILKTQFDKNTLIEEVIAVKVEHALIRLLLNLYKNPAIHLQNTLSFANLGKIVALLKDMNESLSAEDVYALYQRCEERADSYTYVSRAPLGYIYEHLSEEMRQREFEADSIRSLALCVFGVTGCPHYPTEAICKLISHKGWAKLLKDTASMNSSSLHYIEEVMAYICKSNEVINQSIIDAFRNNLHQFKPLFILEAVGNIIRTISYFPKPEYKEVLNSAYDLLMQATVVQNLQN